MQNTNKVIIFVQGWAKVMYKHFATWVRECRMSIYFLIWLPIFASLFIVLAYMSIINFTVQVTLPSLYWFNALHIGMIILCDIVILTILWTLRQKNRFEEAYNLVFASTEMRRIIDAYEGKKTRFASWIFVLLVAFFICEVYVAYTAEWTPVGQFGSLLGLHDCYNPVYNQDTLDKFVVNPHVVSGDTGFAEVYMYGLPLGDGIVIGLGPWPRAAPLNVFTIVGEGPVISVRVECQNEPVPLQDGIAPIEQGSGSKVHQIRTSGRMFNANIAVYLPSNAFAASTRVRNMDSKWIQQECTINGYLGKGRWYFNYLVDEWEVVTAGKSITLDLGERRFGVGESSAHFTEHVTKILRKQAQSPNAYQFSNTTSDGSVILQAVVRALNQTLDNVWYEPA